jgi:hypothetical protein
MIWRVVRALAVVLALLATSLLLQLAPGSLNADLVYGGF